MSKFIQVNPNLNKYTFVDVDNLLAINQLNSGSGYLFRDTSGQWQLTNIPTATSTIIGGVKLFSDTIQTVAASNITTTASRTYGIQTNSNGQLVVNVPWTNTTYLTGSLTELNTGTVSTGKIWSSEVLNSWINSKNYITDASLPTVGNGILSFVVPTGLSISGTFSANQSTNSSFNLSYSTGYKGYTTNEANKLANIESNANNYTLPISSASILGGVMIGSGLSINSSGLLTNASPNIIQTLSQSGQVVTLSNGGGSFTLPTLNETITTISRDGVAIPIVSQNVDIPLFSTTGAGLVPPRVGSVSTKYLREDGTWVTPTNTTYSAGTLELLQAGTNATNRVWSSSILNTWLSEKGYITSYVDTVTRLRGTATGTYTSGDITFLAGSNTTITQSGNNITISSTDTNTTYTGSTSIILSGTSFQRAALTGDVTSAQNSNATTIANNAVTFAKMQNIATQRLLGRGTTGSGNIEELTLGTGLTLSTTGVLSATGSGGTVSSVGLTIAGNALNTNLATITSSGTFGLTWGGTTAQYVNGQGTLVTFPTIPTVGNGSLSIGTPTGLSSSGTFTANQSGNSTITLVYDAGYQGYTTDEANKLAGIEASANNYTLPTATDTVLGGVKLFSNTTQTVAATAVSATANRTYGIQLNSSGQAVVNVPWTNTTYSVISASELTTGTATTGRIINAKVLTDWINGFNFLTVDNNTTYSAGNGLTLTGTTFSLPITVSGSGNYVSDVVANATGLTVTKGTLPVSSLVTTTTTTGISNVATTNTNTFLNIVESGASVGSSTQITGAGSVTVTSDSTGKLTINGTNTTYSGSTSIILSGTSFQRAALTGDVVSTQNSNATTIANNAVTFAKMQNIATQRLLGRGAAGSGFIEELTLGSGLALSASGVLSATGSGGTVTSVGLNTPLGSGLSITNSPIVGAGSITIGYIPGYQGYTIDEHLKLAGIAENANNYTLPAATNTILGGVKLFSNTNQSVAANVVTSAASRTYGIQTNATGQLVVNVPWTDTNIDTTYAAGTLTVLNAAQSNVQNTWSSQILNQWLNGKNYLTPTAMLTYSYQTSVPVSSSIYEVFKDNDFQPLTNVGTAHLYDVSLADGGAGTFAGHTGAARFVIIYDTPNSTWVAHKISQGGGTSANIKIVSGVPVVEINETATKKIYVNARKYRYMAQSSSGWIEFLGLGFDSIQNLPTTLEGFGITNAAKTTTQIVAGNGLTGGGSLATNRTISLGTPGAITLTTSNSVGTTSHTHEFAPGGTTAQYIRGDGSLATFPSIPSGTITSIGMTTPTGLAVSPSTITSSGTFALTYSSGYQGYTTVEANKLASISANANNYILPTATATVLGGVKLFSNTTQTVAATAVSATASRTYGIQTNASGQLVVNVPWVDTNTNTTYSAGTGITLSGTTFSHTAHTGDVTGSTALTIANNAVTFPKMQNIATQRLLGRGTAGIGNIEELTLGNGLSLSTTGVLSATGSGGTVTSVGLTIAGNALNTNLATITSSGTFGLTWGGTTAQYIRGDGSLATMPTIPTVGNGTLSISVPTGLTTTGTFTANQSGNSTISLAYTTGYQGYTTAEANKLADISANANNYILPTATDVVLGGVKLFSNTTQTVAATAVSATASRTYGIQMNSDGQLVVNVPWVDTNTNTTYSIISASELTTGTATTARVINAKVLTDWINGFNFLTVDNNTTYSAGTGLTLSGTTFSLPVAVSGSGNYVTNVVASTNGLTVTKATLPVPSLITSTSATGTTNVATTNTNTYLNIVESGASVGSSTQITGAGSVTVTSDSTGKLTISGTNTNTTYTAGNGLTLSGTAFSLPVTQSGSGNIVSSVVASTNGLTVTKANISFNSLTDLPYFKNKEFEIISTNIVSNIVTLDVADNIYNDSVLVFINGIKLPKSKLSISGQIIQIDNTTLSYQIVVGDLVEVEYLIN